MKLASCVVRSSIPHAAYYRVRLIAGFSSSLQYTQFHKSLVVFTLNLAVLSMGAVLMRGNINTIIVHAQSAQDPQAIFKDPAESKRPTIILPNPINRFNSTSNQPLNDVFKEIQRLIITFGGIAAFIVALYGGFRYMTSAGDPAAANQGKKIVIGAVAGVLIISLGFYLVRFVVELASSAIGK